MTPEDTYWENLWLNSRGGRTQQDVLGGPSGRYVMMNARKGGKEKVFIPSTETIKAELGDNYPEKVFRPHR